jgi:hypothetical protein
MERKQERGRVPGVSDTTAIAAYGDGGDGTVQRPVQAEKARESNASNHLRNMCRHDMYAFKCSKSYPTP